MATHVPGIHVGFTNMVFQENTVETFKNKWQNLPCSLFRLWTNGKCFTLFGPSAN